MRKWGGANMRVVRGGHFSQLGSIACLAETTGGEILVAFWQKHGLTRNLRVPKFSGGACPQTPLASLHLIKRMHSHPSSHLPYRPSLVPRPHPVRISLPV